MAIAARILIVEDERIVARDIQNSLQGMGYTVVGMAASGGQAVKKAEKLRPDLVLMDIVLEGPMTGIEAADIIRSRLNIPVIYLTAYAEKEMMNQAKVTLPFGYILKPFNDRELYRTIEMALYRHRAERKLQVAREEFHNIVQKSTDGTMVLDRKGKILFANSAAGSLWERCLDIP
jgi:CheY-like chemotaxis protein